jgi:hypothetical protein
MPGLPQLMKVLFTVSKAQLAEAPTGGCGSSGPAAADSVLHVAVDAASPLSEMPNSSMGMLEVRSALIVLSVSLSTAALTVAGLVTANFMMLA